MADIPKELLEQRPVLEGDPTVVHPDMGNVGIGKPPRKYTPAVHEKIVEELRKGQRPQGACARAGITVAMFYDWVRRGKQGDPHLYQFAEDVEIAFNEAEASAVDVITEFIEDKSPDASPKLRLEAAQWRLERSRPDGYSKQVKTAVEGQIKEFLLRLEKALPPHIFEMVLAVYLGQSPTAEIGQKAEVILLPEHVETEEADSGA